MSEIEVYDPPRLPALVPEVNAQDLVKRLAVIRDAMNSAMEKDVDYGVIPGTNKPALLKPGAEKLAVLFQLDVQLENEKLWHDDGHLTVVSRATVFHAPTGTRLGAGEAICSTREGKYAYRDAQRLCPDCGEPQVREGKPRDGKLGNWYCWRKMGGCGVTWALDSEQGVVFRAMQTGRGMNPDIPDTYNTVDKMASKRARIDAVLAVTGASALFTQDVVEPESDATSGGAQAAATEVRTDGKRAPEPARSWAVWEKQMKDIGVPDPNTILARYVHALYTAESLRDLSPAARAEALGRANRVMLGLMETELSAAELTLGFVEESRIEAAFAAGFEGVIA